MITLKQIHYALMVEKTRHFKKASEQCFVSQSTLSTAISEMENQLGLQIFERDNKQVLLTKKGEKVLNQFRLIKQNTDDLYTLIENMEQPLSSELSIGVIPTIGPFLLPKVLPQVRKKYPDLKLSLEENQSAVLVEKVKNGELDSAIIALPYTTQGLHVFEFWQEDFYLVSAKTKNIPENVTSENIDPDELMLLQDGHCLKEHALAACSLPVSNMNKTVAGTSLYTLIEMAACNMGVTIAPKMALDVLVENNESLQAVHLNEPGPHRKIAMITRLNYAGVENIEILMGLFKKTLVKKSLSSQ